MLCCIILWHALQINAVKVMHIPIYYQKSYMNIRLELKTLHLTMQHTVKLSSKSILQSNPYYAIFVNASLRVGIYDASDGRWDNEGHDASY
jgi:hypothetical protein